MMQLPSSNSYIDQLKQNEARIQQLETKITQLETQVRDSIDLSSSPTLYSLKNIKKNSTSTKTKNSRVKTAKALNVTVRTIMNKLKEYRLKGEDL